MNGKQWLAASLIAAVAGAGMIVALAGGNRGAGPGEISATVSAAELAVVAIAAGEEPGPGKKKANGKAPSEKDHSPPPAGAAPLPAPAEVHAEGPAAPEAVDAEAPAPLDLVAPEAPPPPLPPPEVHVQAFAGEPFGVGKIEIRFPGLGPVWHEDRPLVVRDAEGRVRYPALAIERATAGDETTTNLQSIKAYFLFHGAGPLKLELLSPDEAFAREDDAEVVDDEKGRKELLSKWWGAYRGTAAARVDEAREFQAYLAQMLARRLRLARPGHLPTSRNEASALEKQFEHSVGMLLGIDSVLLAMQDDQLLHVDDLTAPARPGLPAPLIFRGAVLPQARPDVVVEPLARRVPQECFYIRCGGLSNYLWLRSFVTGWGGSLREIVSRPAWEFDIRRKLERQLALDPALAEKAGIDDAISDMAIIGCDTLFRDGAAVGVLFEATDSGALAGILQEQREAILRAAPDVHVRQVEIGGRLVSQMGAADNSVRSFYAVEGRYHLVTNSHYIVNRFFEAAGGKRDLASLNEFRYARQELRQPGAAAFLYLSDPFFRRLVSSTFRIEMTRRAHAARELKELRMARLAARSEGLPADSVRELVAAGFLPPQFGRRTDGSEPLIWGDREVDSLRGAPGVFLPIADVRVTATSHSERDAYKRFLSLYRQEWVAIDPVVVSLSAAPSDEPGREKVALDIHVTPYARQRYEVFARFLPASADAHAAPIEGDLLALTAKLSRTGGPGHHVRVGLQDADVPFEIVGGKVIPLGHFEGGTFFDRNFYAMATPGGVGGLQVLSAFTDTLQGKRVEMPTTPGSRSPSPEMRFSPLGLVVAPMETLVDLFSSLGKAQKLEKISHGGDWTAYAASSDVRARVLERAGLSPGAGSAPVRLSVADAESAAAWPYIQAYTFLEAREASARNAQFLNLLTEQLRTSPGEAKSQAEYAIGARAICPLGGEYRLAEGDAELEHWVSSAWTAPSLHEEREAPADYRFAFLDWLRGLEAECRIDPQSLHAQVALTIQPRPEPGGEHARRVTLLRPLSAGTATEELSPLFSDEADESIPGDAPIPPAARRLEEKRSFPANLRVGDIITVRLDQAPLKVGERVLTRVPKGTNLSVADVQDPWIGVRYARDGESTAGWLHAQNAFPK